MRRHLQGKDRLLLFVSTRPGSGCWRFRVRVTTRAWTHSLGGLNGPNSLLILPCQHCRQFFVSANYWLEILMCCRCSKEIDNVRSREIQFYDSWKPGRKRKQMTLTLLWDFLEVVPSQREYSDRSGSRLK